MKKEIICFDLDGTLVNADKSHEYSYFKSFKINKIKPITKKQLHSKFGIAPEVFIKDLYPNISKNLQEKIVNDHEKIFIKEAYKYIKPFPGIKQTLKKLKKKYRLVVVSNCRHRIILASLKKARLRSYIDLVIGRDDVKKPKPSPDEILKAKKAFNAKVIFMIGDTIYDVIAGKGAKVKTIAVLTGDHPRKKLEKVKPDLILKSVAKLSQLL